jgi:hypothetical protein
VAVRVEKTVDVVYSISDERVLCIEWLPCAERVLCIGTVLCDEKAPPIACGVEVA